MTDEIVTQSAIVVSEVQVIDQGIVVDTISQILPGGYITIDTTAENIRQCNFSCLDPNDTLTPFGTDNGELMPDGVEVSIAVGFIIDGFPTLWPQGIFGVQEVDVSTSSGPTDSGGGNFPGPGPNITVTGVDRSNRIQINTFEDTFTIPAGTNLAEAIELILSSQAPWCINPNITPTDFEVAQQVYNAGDDPWQQIVALAAAAGMVAYFNVQGQLIVRPTPSLAGQPVAISIVDGPDNVAISVTPSYSNNPGYNGVIVTNTSPAANSASAETQISGSAFDMNPNSPTYALGKYGKRPAPPVQVTTAQTSGQCAAIAAALLPQVLGMSNSVTLDALPLPMIDAYDLVYIKNAETKYDGTVIFSQGTLYMDYTEAEVVTCVPLGGPITDLSYLKGPSQAAFGSTDPYYVGAGSVGYTPFTFTPYSYNSFGSGGGSHGSLLNDFGGAFSLLYVGDRILRVSRHGSHDSSWEDPVEDVAEDL